jgi:hypothetical protein
MTTGCGISHAIHIYSLNYYKDFIQNKKRFKSSCEMLEINPHTMNKLSFPFIIYEGKKTFTKIKSYL